MQTQTAESLTVTRTSARAGTWASGRTGGTIWAAGSGYVADSPAVVITGTAAAHPTMDDAARAAYRREIVMAPELATVASKYRIEHPAAVAAVYAVDANDPRAGIDGEPRDGGRYVNLMPWEREAVKVARAHARLGIAVRDGKTVTLVAVSGGHVTMVRTENGTETGRWRVLDGCRKVALFLA